MIAVGNDIVIECHRSFELAAERCDDATVRVCQRLFREFPEAQPMFRTEGSALVQGSMASLTIEAILDFVGERNGHFRLIEWEVSSHDAYGTPRDLFIALTLRELRGDDWQPAIDAAWHKLLRDVETIVLQHAT